MACIVSEIVNLWSTVMGIRIVIHYALTVFKDEPVKSWKFACLNRSVRWELSSPN